MLKKCTATIIIILSLFNIFFINYIYADDINEEINEKEIRDILLETSNVPTNEPQINSRAAIIFDRNSKQILYSKNINEKRPMASTTKIMTAIIVIENSDLSDTVIVSKKAANTGGSRLKFKTGDKITINDLLYGLMLCSGNDAAVALAEYVGENVDGFADLMNKKAEELGLINTHFVTPHGLDNSNHYTTAYELALLTDYALSNEIFAKIVNTKNYNITINGITRNISNTNELLGNLNGVNGVKTGYTGNAMRCLVTSCTRNNNQIITVVLGADTKKYRTADSKKLIEYAFDNYKWMNLEEIINEELENWKQINQNRIYINKGKYKTIELCTPTDTIKTIPIKKDNLKNISVEINVIYYHEAPIKSGQKIGNIIIKDKNEIIYTVDINIKENIEKKNIIDYIKEFLLRMQIDTFNQK